MCFAEGTKGYDEYYERIVQYLARIAGSNDAEDIAQNVFNKINSGLEGFQGKSKLSTWVYRITTNTAIDRSRSAAYKHSAERTAIEDGADHDVHTVLNDHTSSDIDQPWQSRTLTIPAHREIGLGLWGHPFHLSI
jgi:RNA polymerase sigma-70 factor (ECF subfamily)